MKIAAILFYLIGILAFFGAGSAFQENVGLLIILNGTVFLVGFYIVESIQNLKSPIVKTPEKE